MAPEKKHVIANLAFNKSQPTTLAFAELFTWVIWQFPKEAKGGLCGAVHPPGSEHGWYPAIIHLDTEKVQVFAHVDKSFPTPETAADHFHKNGA
jgi:hypothetical protein